MVKKQNCRSGPHAASRSKKGVSTIIGITIFLLIFAIAVSYTFAWTQNTGNYLQTVNQQVDLDRLKIGENLVVSVINTTALTVTNPTANVIVVSQIWSNGILVWSGQQGISGFGNWTNSTSSGNGQFEVVTTRGNIFSGRLQTLFTAPPKAWQVNWYYSNSANASINPPPTPANLSLSSSIGQSYYYDLNLAWSWTAFNNPVIGNYSISNGTLFGFVASTTLMKLSDSPATINYYVDNSSFSNNSVAMSIVPYGQNATIPSSWDNSSQLILQYGADSNYTVFSGSQYSKYTATIYFYTYNDTNMHLSFNIVNATLALLP